MISNWPTLSMYDAFGRTLGPELGSTDSMSCDRKVVSMVYGCGMGKETDPTVEAFARYEPEEFHGTLVVKSSES